MIILEKSKDSNPNYLAKIIEIKVLKDIPKADNIQITIIDFQDVVVSKDVKIGDIMAYFPIECTINKDFLSFINAFRDSDLNQDKEKTGFFEDKGRVKAIKLFKGTVKSMGYVVPLHQVFIWALGEYQAREQYYDLFERFVNKEFDTINGKLLVEKYVVKKYGPRQKQGKEPKLSRLIDGQVHLHVDTENFRKNTDKIKPTDTVSITYKTHGTSFWVSNVLVKRKLNFIERTCKIFGIKVQETVHDLIYGSRRTVKNAYLEDPKSKDHFFGYDLWEKIKEEVGEHIPKGYTLYGEMLGYDHNGAEIQKGYDYGCTVGEHKLEIYRVTHTTPDGLVTELSYPQIAEFCKKTGLTPSHLFFYGEAWDFCDLRHSCTDDRDFHESFIKLLEDKYNEKDCFMCRNKVPEEGIVIKKEDFFNCEPYKLKSFKFLEWESKQLDKGESDIESEN